MAFPEQLASIGAQVLLGLVEQRGGLAHLRRGRQSGASSGGVDELLRRERAFGDQFGTVGAESLIGCFENARKNKNLRCHRTMATSTRMTRRTPTSRPTSTILPRVVETPSCFAPIKHGCLRSTQALAPCRSTSRSASA